MTFVGAVTVVVRPHPFRLLGANAGR